MPSCFSGLTRCALNLNKFLNCSDYVGLFTIADYKLIFDFPIVLIQQYNTIVVDDVIFHNRSII